MAEPIGVSPPEVVVYLNLISGTKSIRWGISSGSDTKLWLGKKEYIQMA
jgi:hypothetical protein